MLVAGLGQCTMDYIAVVDKYPSEDVKFEVTPWKIYGGGPVATCLVALSRLGIDTRFMGLISNDPAGQFIKEGLITEGVNVDFLVEKTDGISQTAFIIANKSNGKRTIFWARPTVEEITDKEISPNFLKNASLLHLDGLMMNASIYTAKIAQTMNIPVMYDAGSLRDGFEELISLCDYVVCSEVFSIQLTKGKHEETLKYLIDRGAKMAAVTLGAKGSVNANNNNDTFHQPTFKVNVVDTTGAGDVFHAGYIYGILQGWHIYQIAQFATALAALKCTKVGGRDGIPTLDETLAFLEKYSTFRFD
ncbi:MAG: PfkB family carbohydrate kinase [Candidatus Magnetoovum sp. WYHC-5]|nr:PfkB family carbohydrate kinase [Candidatus Magnetoovum sp. WYHC-5]